MFYDLIGDSEITFLIENSLSQAPSFGRTLFFGTANVGLCCIVSKLNFKSITVLQNYHQQIQQKTTFFYWLNE
jgi:hypothetical protein